MLDFYADWCVECKRMERNTFPDTGVQGLLDQFQLLQADVTANDDVDQALMKSFGIIGPPAILFFDSDWSGNEGVSPGWLFRAGRVCSPSPAGTRRTVRKNFIIMVVVAFIASSGGYFLANFLLSPPESAIPGPGPAAVAMTPSLSADDCWVSGDRTSRSAISMERRSLPATLRAMYGWSISGPPGARPALKRCRCCPSSSRTMPARG